MIQKNIHNISHTRKICHKKSINKLRTSQFVHFAQSSPQDTNTDDITLDSAAAPVKFASARKRLNKTPHINARKIPNGLKKKFNIIPFDGVDSYIFSTA